MNPSNGDISSTAIDTIQFPDFDISWAGGRPWPWTPGYCFGSDDGMVQFTGLDSIKGDGPYEVSPSKDAVNGIAFAGDLMAVSTRSDVTFLNVPRPGEGHQERAVFPGGAHGVAATQGGSIVAPMGRRGILLMGPKQGRAQSVKFLGSASNALNYYKIISLASPGRGEFLACAARRSGFAVLPLLGEGLGGFGKKLHPKDVDFVDVAPLNVDGFPFAGVALGLDCSLHFMRDMAGDGTTKTLSYGDIGERAYRILCSEGHVFLLTDRRLYAFSDLASDFLAGHAIDGPTLVRGLDLEAVDASLAPDGSLLVVMPDSVYRITVGSLVAKGMHASRFRPSSMGESEPARESTPREEWESTSWEESEEYPLELAAAGG